MKQQKRELEEIQDTIVATHNNNAREHKVLNTILVENQKSRIQLNKIEVEISQSRKQLQDKIQEHRAEFLPQICLIFKTRTPYMLEKKAISYKEYLNHQRTFLLEEMEWGKKLFKQVAQGAQYQLGQKTIVIPPATEIRKLLNFTPASILTSFSVEKLAILTLGQVKEMEYAQALDAFYDAALWSVQNYPMSISLATPEFIQLGIQWPWNKKILFSAAREKYRMLLDHAREKVIQAYSTDMLQDWIQPISKRDYGNWAMLGYLFKFRGREEDQYIMGQVIQTLYQHDERIKRATKIMKAETKQVILVQDQFCQRCNTNVIAARLVQGKNKEAPVCDMCQMTYLFKIDLLYSYIFSTLEKKQKGPQRSIEYRVGVAQFDDVLKQCKTFNKNYDWQSFVTFLKQNDAFFLDNHNTAIAFKAILTVTKHSSLRRTLESPQQFMVYSIYGQANEYTSLIHKEKMTFGVIYGLGNTMQFSWDGAQFVSRDKTNVKKTQLVDQYLAKESIARVYVKLHDHIKPLRAVTVESKEKKMNQDPYA